MDGEVILVAVDASKEITDYALEWAVRNVVKPTDSLILLAVLSSHGRPPASANRTHQSRVHQFLSCVLKKWGLGQNEGSSADQMGLVNGTGNEVSKRINNVCVKMMQQLCSVHNIMQVHTEVKVVADAQMGSVAAKAGELGASWVILDRGAICILLAVVNILIPKDGKANFHTLFGCIRNPPWLILAPLLLMVRRLKKEGDCCLKQLQCNIILVDHAIPKILRTVNTPTVKKFNTVVLPRDPTVADMLGVLPSYNLDSNSITTHSSIGIESPRSDTDVTFSLSSTDKDQFHKRSPSITKNKPPDNFLPLNSQFFHQEVETQATFRPRPSYSKSQPLHKVPQFEIDESPRKSSASPLEDKTKSYQATFKPTPSYSKSQPLHKVSRFEIDESPRKSSAGPWEDKTKSYRGLLKTRSDMNKGNGVKVTQTAPIPPRRSTDLPHSWQKPGILDVSKQLINNGTGVKATPPILSRRSTDSPLSWRKPVNPNKSKQLTFTRESIIGNRIDAIAAPSSPTVDRTSSIRRAMSLSIKQPPTPPPLCSVCKHNAPIFGKALRKFSYKEVEQATDGFSVENFLAEGGYGPVYRGELPDGQVVAVKQHRMLSAQGASEFCSEVEVLSCAQHRNLVMLVGYCIETEWLLIYEFACNGSLDKHLYGTETNEVMLWYNRMKVAIGAARGLRYLHEDCRVGCIIHRDFRPNNILLTHDFEPMVGDFGLARCQADGQSAEETRVIGAFGYLAPEYTQTGLITEKTDVYAFGVVLLELLSGFKATELTRNVGLTEWGRLLLDRVICRELIDPRLEDNYVEKEVDCMIYAASLCISPHPELRPRMSKVLKILEGDMPSDIAYQYRQESSISPRQEMSGYATDRPLKQALDFSPSSHLMQSMHHMSLSPTSQSAHTNSDNNATFNQMKPSNKVVSGGWSSNHPEGLVSEEYQAYLQGSLTQFIQNLNQK